ncbi:MAG: ATP-binding protein [Desulfamplus sp.]
MNNKMSNKPPFFQLKLRNILFILVLVIFIPISLLLVFQGYQDRTKSLAEAERQAAHLTRIFIDQQRHILEHTQHLLEVLSQVTLVSSYNIKECNKFLKILHKSHPEYSTLVLADNKGDIRCCALPLNSPINISDRSWFKKVQETKKFVIGDFIMSRTSKKASLPFAYPILDDDGNFKMAVGAAFDLSYYNKILNNIDLMPDSITIVIDKNKNILYLSDDSQPDKSKSDSLIGQPLDKIRGFSVPDESKGVFTVKDIDKTKRIYWFERLNIGESDNEISLLIGFSKKAIFSKADKLMLINIAALSLAALISFGFGWLFGEQAIVKPINLLIKKIQRLQNQKVSDLDDGIDENIYYSTEELELLSIKFDEMIDKLEQRELERDKAAYDLKRSEDRYRSLVETQTDLVCRYTPDGTFTFINNTYCNFFNKTKEELLGSKWYPVPVTKDLGLIKEQLAKLSPSNTTVTIENRVYSGKGEIRWMEFVNRAFFDQDGNILELQSVGRDITDKKESAEEIRRLNAELEIRVAERTAQLDESNKTLEAINKELEAFSYSVSHDLRAPIRGIDGWSLALLEDFENILGEEGKKYIDRIREETKHMENLIDDMLKLSRLTRSEMILTSVNLSESALKVANFLNESASERGEPERKVQFIIEPDLTAYADAGMIDIVLNNLIGNSFKFTSKIANPKIEFGKLDQKDNGRDIFFVKDNGAGFDMNYSFKLFTPFQRLHKTSEFPGTGIGLATVQRIIYRHGGRVWIEAEVNKGAVFYFTL